VPKLLYPKCPICGDVLRSDNARMTGEGAISRRRFCANGHLFISEERIIRVLKGADELIRQRSAEMALASWGEGGGNGKD
jgi:hypothetical protein